MWKTFPWVAVAPSASAESLVKLTASTPSRSTITNYCSKVSGLGIVQIINNSLSIIDPMTEA